MTSGAAPLKNSAYLSTKTDACTTPMRSSSTPMRAGRPAGVNVEVASGHYSASTIRAKANAGFVVYAAERSQARVLRALGTGND